MPGDKDIVQSITDSKFAGWVSSAIIVGIVYWFAQGLIVEMHGIRDDIIVAAKLEEERDENWEKRDRKEALVTEKMHLLIREEQSKILSALATNNGLLTGLQSIDGSILSSVNSLAHSLGIYQGQHDQEANQ